MRVSDNSRMDSMIRAINVAKQQNVQASQQASTGSRINAPSDDPLGAAQALRVQTSLDQTNTYRTTIRTVRGDVELSESSLAEVISVLGRAHEIALSAGSEQTTSIERQSYAKESQGLKERLLSLMNQKGSQGYLFGGSKTGAPPFDSSGTFIGDDSERRVQIGANVISVASVSGAQAFTAAGGQDITAMMTSMIDALSANDPAAVRQGISGLGSAINQVIAARSDAGLKIVRLDAADTAHSQAQLALTTGLHQIVDTDPAASYSRLVTTQQSLQQAITVSKSMLDTLSSARLA